MIALTSLNRPHLSFPPLMGRRPLVGVTSRAGLAFIGLLALSPAIVAAEEVQTAASLQAPGLHREVAFDKASPLASNAALAKRLLSPRVNRRLEQSLAKSGHPMLERPYDLQSQRFIVYVPEKIPASGYGVLIFIPPWSDTKLPTGWGPVLDRFGLIFVSAAGSGNDADIIGRREPLALDAAYNATLLYRTDPQRIYVGGFSGGSRVALRVALSYPDIFQGALLDAGSDPIGDAAAPLPSAALMARFQAKSRLVLVSGAVDEINVDKDAESLSSLRRWCVVNAEAFTTPNLGHDPLGSAPLARALAKLDEPIKPEATTREDCRASLAKSLKARLAGIERLKTAGELAKVSSALDRLDRDFGGLAAPFSLLDLDPIAGADPLP